MDCQFIDAQILRPAGMFANKIFYCLEERRSRLLHLGGYLHFDSIAAESPSGTINEPYLIGEHGIRNLGRNHFTFYSDDVLKIQNFSHSVSIKPRH